MTENATKNTEPTETTKAPRWEIVDVTPGREEEILGADSGKLAEAKEVAQHLFDLNVDAGRVILRPVGGGKTKKAFERELGNVAEGGGEVVTTADPDLGGHKLGIPSEATEEKEEAKAAKIADLTAAKAEAKAEAQAETEEAQEAVQAGENSEAGDDSDLLLGEADQEVTELTVEPVED